MKRLLLPAALAAALLASGARAVTIDEPLGTPQAPLDAAPDVPDRNAPPKLVDALAKLNAGDYDGALAAVRSELSKPGAVGAAANEIAGSALAKQGDLDGSLARLGAAVVLEPSRRTAWSKLGDVELARGRAEAARAAFDRVLAIDPEDRIAHQRLGILDQRAGRFDDAIAHYEKGIRGTPPGYVGVKIDLARLYNASGRSPQTVALLGDLADADPPDPAVLSLLGAAQLELGLAADAAVTLRRRGRLAPEDARAWVLLATAEQQAGRSEEAAQAAARAVEAAPEWSGAQIAAAEVALAAGRLDDARAHAERAAALSKDPSAARLVTAKVELASGDKAAAGRRLGELVESGAASREAYTLLGRLRLEGGDLAGAEAVYARMLERYPNDAVAAREAGVFYGYQRRYAEAADHFERALSLRPGDREALRQLAWAEIQGGRSERGLDHARQLVAAAPTPENRFVLASALERSGQLEAAAQTYQEVIQESPEHFGAIASLSLLRAREERWAEAKKLARRAAALLPAGSPSLQPLQPILDRPD